MPSEFRDIMSKNEETETEIKEKTPPGPKKKVKHPTGLPLHRDGKKVDLFGLYSRKPKSGTSKNEKKSNKK
jgi:hypothetical protein